MNEFANMNELNKALKSFDDKELLNSKELETLQELNDSIDNIDSGSQSKIVIREWLENNMLDKFKFEELITKLESNDNITEEEVWEVFDTRQFKDQTGNI
jgi:hypothetical protein